MDPVEIALGLMPRFYQRAIQIAGGTISREQLESGFRFKTALDVGIAYRRGEISRDTANFWFTMFDLSRLLGRREDVNPLTEPLRKPEMKGLPF